MSEIFPPKIVIALALLSAIALAGCIHQKTHRGHLVRGDWAIEYNRPPWIGCPSDVDCEQEGSECERKSLFSCLKRDDDGTSPRAFRRHCATIPACTSEVPCCRTLGCGMWVEPSDDSEVKVCGLTPFCFAQKPCGLTPNCGKPIPPHVNPPILTTGNQPIPGGLGANVLGTNVSVLGGLGGIPVMRGMSPAMPAAGTMPGTLVSRGIVPGASAITSGGMVAAIGVTTPAGTMTPVGVRMPNGMVSNAMVLRACVMVPHCTAANPCRQTPHCGGAVAVNLVANNAIALASALQGQGMASGVMQQGTMLPGGGVMSAGGTGFLINPMTGQLAGQLTGHPLQGQMGAGQMGTGQMMGVSPQMGQMLIDYTESGYLPGHPHYAMGVVEPGGAGEVPERRKEENVPPEMRSQMPPPRFHPIPTQPTFQRSEGMPPTPPAQRTTAMNEARGVSEEEMEAALDRVYLEGVAAAMDEVERKLEAKRQAVARARLEERILQQAESVQQQLDEQARIQMLAMQHVQQERQLWQQTLAEPIPEPQRIPPPRQTATAQNPPQSSLQSALQNSSATARTGGIPNVNPVHLAESLKSSVANGVNEVFAPLLSSPPKGQSAATSQAAARTQGAAASKPEPETALTPPQLPGRPPVASRPPEYGLLPDDESDSSVLQAQFVNDGAVIRQ